MTEPAECKCTKTTNNTRGRQHQQAGAALIAGHLATSTRQSNDEICSNQCQSCILRRTYKALRSRAHLEWEHSCHNFVVRLQRVRGILTSDLNLLNPL